MFGGDRDHRRIKRAMKGGSGMISSHIVIKIGLSAQATLRQYRQTKSEGVSHSEI